MTSLLLVLLPLAASTPAIGAGQPPPPVALLREWVAETALAQAGSPDPGWNPDQRDCAGLVRFTYRSAYLRFEPARIERGLWRDRAGAAVAFADAETLVRESFALLGRDEAARAALASGDLLAFRQTGGDGEPVYHLMLVVRPGDPAHAGARVVYHPGARDAAVRVGTLEALATDAPAEWRPIAANPSFLGFFRYREWM